MRRLTAIAALLLALVVAAAARAGEPPRPPADPCTSNHPGGGQNFGIVVDGSPRVVHLHLPIDGTQIGQRLPLLLALHGFNGTGSGMEAYTGLSSLANSQKFIAAYPDARGRQWAIHDRGPRGMGEIEFIRRLIADSEKRFCIDRARVFVVGVSNGGGEAARIACALSDKLRGVALVAGQYGNLPPCAAERPVSILEIHAQSDNVAPYAGGEGSVPDFIGMWRTIDRCGASRLHRRLDATSVQTSWSCADGSRVAQLLIQRRGHFWPGPTLHGYVQPAATSAAARIWAFFRTLR